MRWLDKLRGGANSQVPASQKSDPTWRPGDRVSRPTPSAAVTGRPGVPPTSGPAPSQSSDPLTSPAATKFLKHGGEQLMAIPGMATRLLQVLNDPEASVNIIAQEVSRDQGLMAMTLRLANSAFYRSSGQVRDITESVVVLGYDTMRQLVLGQLSRKVLRKNDATQKTLWRHALATALAGQACARELRGVTVAYAFTGGLLHDIGKAVMHEASTEACVRVWNGKLTSDRATDELEHDEFGTDHLEVGAELLRAWQFPAMYMQVARHHAHLDRSVEDPKVQRLVWIVALSGAVASWAGHDAVAGREGRDPHAHPLLGELAAVPTVIDRMRSHIEAELGPLMAVFG